MQFTFTCEKSTQSKWEGLQIADTFKQGQDRTCTCFDCSAQYRGTECSLTPARGRGHTQGDTVTTDQLEGIKMLEREYMCMKGMWFIVTKVSGLAIMHSATSLHTSTVIVLSQ